MFKKIKLIKKFMSIVKVVEKFYDKNRDKYIQEAKESLPIIKGYISDFERFLKKL